MKKIVVGSVILIMLIVVGIISMYFQSNDTISSGILSGAISGFGAIIGGAITLIGVLWTIKRQDKKDRLNKLPSNIIDSWKIQKQFAFPIGLYSNLTENPNLSDERIVDDFYKENEEWVTELGATVSGQVYNLVNSFFTHISDYSTFKKRNDLDNWYEKAFEFQKELGEIIDSFEKEYEKLQ